MERIRRTAARIAQALDDLLFPEEVLCLCCERALGEDAEDGVCPACLRALERLCEQEEEIERQGACDPPPPGVTFVHAAYVYEAQARTLIHQLKYRHVRAAAKPLAQAMSMLPSGEEELIVPVPTDRRRQRRRGYNQAALLAQGVGRALGMPVEEALVRTRRSTPQTGLSRAARERNLEGCMAARDTVRGRRVLLVDDVYTTGATVREAARALLAAGALSVGAFTAARRQWDDHGDPDPFSWLTWAEKGAIPDKIHGKL